jgi:hypothetical protein
MLREEVINDWTRLKEKVNCLKLTEQDKKTIDYLRKSPLINFFPYNNSPDDLTRWEKAIQTFDEQLFEFETNSELATDYWFLFTVLVRAVSSWIKITRWNKDLKEYIKELKGDNNGSNSGNDCDSGVGPTIEEVD